MFTTLILATTFNTQNININKINNNNYEIVAHKNTKLKITNDEKLEIILNDDKGHVYDNGDGKGLTINIKKNHKYDLNAQTGWDNTSFKINNKKILIKANK